MRESGEALVKRLGKSKGLMVLDLGCGNGTTAIPAAKLGAEVLGVDIASNLVAAGNKRAKELGLANCRFQEGDAADILFESRRLPGYGQNGLPPEAIRVDLFFLKHQHLDRDMDKCVMQKSDNQAGFASHRGVHGIARIQIT
jgi:SAM-dependent methyltransferase